MDGAVVDVDTLDDILAYAGAGGMKAHVHHIPHLREAPAIHKALREAVAMDRWTVKNPGQVAAAVDMELTLGRMAEALDDIRRGGDGDIGPAVDFLETCTKEFSKQKVFGTERSLDAVARPALQVVTFARKELAVAVADPDFFPTFFELLIDLVDAAAGEVQRARELPVRLDPMQEPIKVKSLSDIRELAPSDEDSPLPPESEEAWSVGPVVVVTSVDKMYECTDMYFDLVRNMDAKGWRVLGVQKLWQIGRLYSCLQCLDVYLKKIRRSQILLDAQALDQVLEELEKDAFKLFADVNSGMDALKADAAALVSLSEIPGQIHDIVKEARTKPLNTSKVHELAGIAAMVIDLLRQDFPVVFYTDNGLPDFVL